MRKIIEIFVCILLIGTTFTINNAVTACTGFTASEDENVLVGCNFDWSKDFNVYMNVFPSQDGKFGRIVFDMYWPWFDDPEGILPIQGINDQGLFYDTYYTPYLKPVNSSGKPIFENNDPEHSKYKEMGILPYCLAECSTVTEVLAIFDQYNLEFMTDGQCFFVDSSGDSVIIEGDDIIYKEGDYQVVTNFLHSHPGLGGYPCSRYETAVNMLEAMTDLEVEYFRSICEATQQSSTVFSNIYDLNQEKIWLHYFCDYDRCIEIDLNQELAKGKSRIYLGTFFEPEDNNPPVKPESPTGKVSAKIGEEIEYQCIKTSDPDDDKLTYLFDWGDETDSGWLPKSISLYVTASHIWTEPGNYEIKVKAMDIYGRESEWSDPLPVEMPKTKTYNYPLLQRIFDRFPYLEELINTFVRLIQN